MNSSSKDRLVVAVDGGIHKTSKGMTGAAAAIVFHLHKDSPDNRREVVSAIRIEGRFYDQAVTNNRMELRGFALGTDVCAYLMNEFDSIIHPEVEFWSDSQYSLGVLFRSNWRAKENKDLIALVKANLNDLGKRARIAGKFIRAHKGYFLNELADLVAAISIKRQSDITHDLVYRDLESYCLFCQKFPCALERDAVNRFTQIKKWGDRFKAVRNTAYTPPCVHQELYDAEFTLESAKPVGSSQKSRS